MKALRLLVLAVASVAWSCSFAPARADEPPNFTYSPAPPGTIAQSQVVYLAGEAMHSQWRIVISKKQVGTGTGGTRFYQWYVSLYAIDGTTYKLKYRSPGNGGPLDAVAKANGAPMWFPVQTAKIAGIGELMEPTLQQAVVQAHQMAADCGSATVTVFAFDPKTQKVVASAFVENGCDLSAKIVKSGAGNAVLLSGPYYGPNAAMCCPTKPKASATLRFANGKWTQTPAYYSLKSAPSP